MESILNSGGRGKDKIGVFTPLLDDSDDFSLNLFSPNIFGMNGSKPSLSPHHEEVAPSTSKIDKKRTVFNGPIDESLLASPNPGSHYELLYGSEVTPIKRDLFGCPPSDKSDSDSESSDTLGYPSSPTQQLYNLKQVVANSCIRCPACKMTLHSTYSENLGKPAFARELHRHFNACLNFKIAREAETSTKPKQVDKQLEMDISRNVARVRKAIGKFELQDRIKIMESLYRLGKTAASKTHGPTSNAVMLYPETSAPSVNETVDSADQQVLSLLYSNLNESTDSSSTLFSNIPVNTIDEISTQRCAALAPISTSNGAPVRNTKKRRAPSNPCNEPGTKHRRQQSIGATPTADMMMRIFGRSRTKRKQKHTW